MTYTQYTVPAHCLWHILSILFLPTVCDAYSVFCYRPLCDTYSVYCFCALFVTHTQYTIFAQCLWHILSILLLSTLWHILSILFLPAVWHIISILFVTHTQYTITDHWLWQIVYCYCPLFVTLSTQYTRQNCKTNSVIQTKTTSPKTCRQEWRRELANLPLQLTGSVNYDASTRKPLSAFPLSSHSSCKEISWPLDPGEFFLSSFRARSARDVHEHLNCSRRLSFP